MKHKNPSRLIVGSLLLLLFVEGCTQPKASQILRQNYYTHQEISKNSVYKNFILPKENADNVIYLMIAMNENDGTSPFEINPLDTVNIQEFLRKKNLHDKNLKQSELFNLLLDVEIKIRTMMKNRPNLMRAVVYVGQAKNLMQRAVAHRLDILDETKKIQNAKVRWLNNVLKRHYIRLAYLLSDIPKEHLSIFECLVGHLFSVLDFKGSSQLGTSKAWEQLQHYFQTRKRMHALEALGLTSNVEQDREYLREIILPFTSPWHQ